MNHTSILTLLRSGALEQAEKEYFRLGLDKDRSSEDVMALGGRILKARALEQQGAVRQRLALQAAEKYGEAYAHTGGTYSGINMAALALVGGDQKTSHATAQAVLDALKESYAKPGADAYYHIATVAEAELISCNYANAERALADAVALDPHNYAAHASTLHQFDMLLSAQGHVNDWLMPFRPPKALHYAGHMFGTDGGNNALDRSAVHALENAVDDRLEAETIGAAYGALAAGSDILIAERLLEHGADLHVVQPCPDALFTEMSLLPYGRDWRARFDACMKAAASVRYISKDPSLADELTCAFASETAKGLAVMYAKQLATEAVQLLVWDGKTSDHPGGTARDAQLWQQTGRRQLIVPYEFRRARAEDGAPWHESNRSLKAMLFADARGFGKLTEVQVPLFINHVFGALASCLDHQCSAVRHINTWGDGLFFVFDTVAEAAEAAVTLQACFRAIDFAEVGLPESMALRIGGHYGPVHALHDPFLKGTGVFGREVTVAARIEPVTAPGSVFVSEPFACALEAEGNPSFRCEPIGEAVPSKDQGPLTLFSLRKINLNDAAD